MIKSTLGDGVDVDDAASGGILQWQHRLRGGQLAAQIYIEQCVHSGHGRNHER